jgi:SAM-dependent MidA family methyltransferase
MRVEWKRSQVASPPTDDGETALVERIRTEIEHDGPITFARFMQRALYEPGLGYYATSAERPTRAGDFLTAPELHPLFGHTVARQVDEIWRRLDRPDGFVLREYGAGTGALGKAVLDGLRDTGSPLAEHMVYEPIEIPGRLPEQARAPGRTVGCVIANEFLDALPVHRVVKRDGRLVELLVGWRDRAFVDLPAELSDKRLASWFSDAGVQLAEGQRAEVNLAMLDWLAAISRDLLQGAVLVFDYGAGAAELYSPARMTGTLRAFREQHVSSDPYGGVGRQDLTAHVDFDALERGARALELDVLGRTRQADFLLASGLEDAYSAARGASDSDWEAALTLRSAVRRLLDTRALGGYGVVALGRGLNADPPLRGLPGPHAPD